MNSRLLEKIPLIRNRTKVLISVNLLLLAFILCALNQYDLDRKLCLLAMLFSFIGDVALNCKPLERRSHSLLYIGAFFFMISHVMYAAAYYQLIQLSGYPYVNLGSILAVIIMVSILCISIYGIRKSQRVLNPSMILVFSTYLLMISTNFVTIYSYSWNFHALSFVGATSFLISDYIIGIETVFKIKNNTLRKLVWIFYPVGQILILACR